MPRRNILVAAFAVIAGLIASVLARIVAPAAAAADHPKVVYHLCDLDKVSFVLGNIQNHYDGMGGANRVTIALVVHGPALRAFHADHAGADIAQRMRGFAKDGLELNACGNTMRAQNVTLKDLLPGFINAERGGVVRIAELQAQGYAYLRP
jgi:intracellular sulfur oxidation DsrE/DsrF family protein